MSNLKLWESVCQTDPKFTKKVGYGNKFTSINAQYQLKIATDKFGSYGKGFGIKELKHRYITFDDGRVLCTCSAEFFYKEGEDINQFPISSSIMVAAFDKQGNLRVDDEYAKKIETDITTKALSKLGFNADVFEGRYDDNRYVNSMKQKFSEVKKEEPKSIEEDSLENPVFNKPKHFDAIYAALTEGTNKEREAFTNHLCTKVGQKDRKSLMDTYNSIQDDKMRRDFFSMNDIVI